FFRTYLAQSLRIAQSDLNTQTPIRALGLDSLRTVEFKHAVDALLDADVPLAWLLSDRSIRALAEALACNGMQAVTPAIANADLEHKLELSAAPSLKLSHAQKAIWVVHNLEAGSVGYNLHFAIELEGALHAETVRQAFDRLRLRHEQLRMRFQMKGDDVEQYSLQSHDWPEYFVTVDTSGWREADIQTDMAQRISEPFDLDNGDTLHITLYVLNKHRHILLFCAHHIAVDLRAALILLDDLKIQLEYEVAQDVRQPPRRPKNTASYHDFVTWQQNYLQSTVCQADREYWRNRLDGTLPILALPTDYPRPPVPAYRGASHTLQLGPAQTQRLKHLGRINGATLFVTLLAVYKVLLYRYTHQHDLIVGTASSGRPQARFMDVVGNFVNPVALRSQLDPSRIFSTYLQQIRDSVSDALVHADYPFSLLVEQLQPERNADHWPIYQTWLGLQQDSVDQDDNLARLMLGSAGQSQKWSRWTLTPKVIDQSIENFDLRLMAADHDDGLLLSFKYRSDLFQAQTIARMAGHFQTLVDAVTAAPEIKLGALSMLTDSEWTRQVAQWNATTVSFPVNQTLHGLFEAQANENPDRAAVTCDGAETVVGLCLMRSTDLLVGILGVLKAGGAYLPVDFAMPSTRINTILADSKAAMVITHGNLADGQDFVGVRMMNLDEAREAIDAQSGDNPQTVNTPEQLAYVLYTSGSTGKPKGVAVTHGNIVNSTQAREHIYPHRIEGFLLLSSYTFDSSMAGLFGTLGQGGCVVMPPEGGEKDPQILGRLLSTEKITHLLCLPSLYTVLLDRSARMFQAIKHTHRCG
ncbi:condensation domain-containing protein, partial [Nitrosomonas sp.]|uniref:non-ribosomal peptide synthetase n=1 Tax=Nitrosomonas sp. TaxID=42353 RepID=UPI0028471E1C